MIDKSGVGNFQVCLYSEQVVYFCILLKYSIRANSDRCISARMTLGS